MILGDDLQGTKSLLVGPRTWITGTRSAGSGTPRRSASPHRARVPVHGRDPDRTGAVAGAIGGRVLLVDLAISAERQWLAAQALDACEPRPPDQGSPTR